MYTVEDNVDSVRSAAVVNGVIDELCMAVQRRRAQAGHIAVAALGGSALLSSQYGEAAFMQVDCCQAARGRSLAPTEAVQSFLAEECAPIQAGPTRRTVMVLDSLSAFLFWDAAQGLQLLEQLTREPRLSAVLALVHTDMHPAWEVEEVRRLTSGTLEIRAAQDGAAPRRADGTLVLSLKRRTGRMRVEKEEYRVLPDGSLHRSPLAPADAGIPAAGALHGTAHGSRVSQARQVDPVRGGMRLSLTDTERAARNGVVLPWEHSQAGCASQDDLQPVALPGQRVAPDDAGATPAGMGFILYDRDSDNDDVDSDEDPDDDLDV
ncbi:hypothetical protein WJX81_000757 [Elliptochloris bilobata]|uniref:Elongator complex protein 5 n=1 Tax=Elliptochloris bilobata TaxID=381761 RepID=A0AAW1R101_9CHLO